MPDVECSALTCTFCEPKGRYGVCRSPKGIILKFRAAIDTDKRTLVFMECLNMELPKDREAKNAGQG